MIPTAVPGEPRKKYLTRDFSIERIVTESIDDFRFTLYFPLRSPKTPADCSHILLLSPLFSEIILKSMLHKELSCQCLEKRRLTSSSTANFPIIYFFRKVTSRFRMTTNVDQGFSINQKSQPKKLTDQKSSARNVFLLACCK